MEHLQVVPSYEHGELILKNYKEILSQTRPTVFVPGGNPNADEVLLSKDIVYSEVLNPFTLFLAVLIVAVNEVKV